MQPERPIQYWDPLASTRRRPVPVHWRLDMSRPSETDALLKEAGALLERDRFADALPVIDRALALDPQSDYGLWYRGCALSALGRHAEAAATYLQLSKVA